MHWPDIEPLMDYGVAVGFATILLYTFLRYQGRLVRVMETQATTLAKLTVVVETQVAEFRAHRDVCERIHSDWNPQMEPDDGRPRA